MINVPLLSKGLKTRSFGRKVYAFGSIDSTNNCARTMANAEAPEGTVVTAEFQTEGKGRLGRPWVSNPEENLTFSVVLRPGKGSESLSLLPLLVGVAVAEAIHDVTGQEPECKWPNDLLLGGKKVCGILLEGVQREDTLDFVVAGIGINVNQEKFPPEIAETATSLRLACGREFNREQLLRAVLQRFERLYRNGRDEQFSSVPGLWSSHTHMLGKLLEIRAHDSTFAGTALRIAPDGGLVIASGTGEQTLYAGDVTIRSVEQPAP
jgi:BirA family biotin operon repressor/biotin-[acetyl-CoA-carboxylase] ligase